MPVTQRGLLSVSDSCKKPAGFCYAVQVAHFFAASRDPSMIVISDQ